MRILDAGAGPPVVVVPGIQGRWEWVKPGIDALAARCRVVTFSLADEPSALATFDERNGFASYVDQVRDAMDQAGLATAAICGISYGGLIASAFAARYPERVSSLVLISAIPPSWRPDRRVRFYLRAPRLLSPLFCIASLRMLPEFTAPHGGLLPGLLAASSHAWRALTHMFSPFRMARRVALLVSAGDLRSALATVSVPTLVVAGEPALDRVVPVRLTSEYLTLWPHAEMARIDRTGHLGIVTRPAEVARRVSAFVERAADPAGIRRRVG